jgi:hypothetical protein
MVPYAATPPSNLLFIVQVARSAFGCSQGTPLWPCLVPQTSEFDVMQKEDFLSH